MRKNHGQQFARLISGILNPFLMAMVGIVLVAFKSRSSVLSAVRWSLVLAVISIAPILLFTAYLVRKGRLDSLFSSVRQQRTEVFLLASAVTAVDYVILHYINAPGLLIAILATGLLGLIIFMCINFWWKISLHTALIAGLVTVMVMLYGWLALTASVLVIVIGWARLELREHTVMQVVTGALLAALVSFATFHLFGFV